MSKNFIKVPEDYFALIEINGINYGHVCLLSKIESLSMKDGKCTASNDYFASLLHTTGRTIKRMMSDLRENDIIKTFEKKQGIKTTTRFIYLQHDIITSLIGTGDNNDTSTSEAGDISGNSRGQNVSEEVTTLVEGGDNVGQSRCQDCPPNKRLEENKKEKNRIIRENESNESSLFANALGDADARAKASSDSESGFPEVDRDDEVIALFKKGCKYPEIQRETGLNGKQINQIIKDYKSGSTSSGTDKGKSKDDTGDYVPLASGGLSRFKFSEFDISEGDYVRILNLVTDPNGEYRFDYDSFSWYVKEKYNVNIVGKHKPQKIDYEGIAASQKANPKPDTGDEIDSLTDEIFDIETVGSNAVSDIDLMNELYADEQDNGLPW